MQRITLLHAFAGLTSPCALVPTSFQAQWCQNFTLMVSMLILTGTCSVSELEVCTRSEFVVFLTCRPCSSAARLPGLRWSGLGLQNCCSFLRASTCKPRNLCYRTIRSCRDDVKGHVAFSTTKCIDAPQDFYLVRYTERKPTQKTNSSMLAGLLHLLASINSVSFAGSAPDISATFDPFL